MKRNCAKLRLIPKKLLYCYIALKRHQIHFSPANNIAI